MQMRDYKQVLDDFLNIGERLKTAINQRDFVENLMTAAAVRYGIAPVRESRITDMSDKLDAVNIANSTVDDLKAKYNAMYTVVADLLSSIPDARCASALAYKYVLQKNTSDTAKAMQYSVSSIKDFRRKGLQYLADQNSGG